MDTEMVVLDEADTSHIRIAKAPMAEDMPGLAGGHESDEKTESGRNRAANDPISWSTLSHLPILNHPDVS
jgi:hypothetical protein